MTEARADSEPAYRWKGEGYHLFYIPARHIHVTELRIFFFSEDQATQYKSEYNPLSAIHPYLSEGVEPSTVIGCWIQHPEMYLSDDEVRPFIRMNESIPLHIYVEQLRCFYPSGQNVPFDQLIEILLGKVIPPEIYEPMKRALK